MKKWATPLLFMENKLNPQGDMIRLPKHEIDKIKNPEYKSWNRFETIGTLILCCWMCKLAQFGKQSGTI